MRTFRLITLLSVAAILLACGFIKPKATTPPEKAPTYSSKADTKIVRKFKVATSFNEADDLFGDQAPPTTTKKVEKNTPGNHTMLVPHQVLPDPQKTLTARFEHSVLKKPTPAKTCSCRRQVSNTCRSNGNFGTHFGGGFLGGFHF